MGALEGAIIGGVIGGITAVIMMIRTSQWQKKFVKAVEAGDKAGAHRELSRRAPAVKQQKSFPLAKIIPQRSRVIGLWMLGDLNEVTAELEMHRGGPAYIANVEMFGLLALAISPGVDPAPLVERIASCAERVRTESNKLQKLLRDLADLLARISGGLVGRPVSEEDSRTLLTRTMNEPLLTKILFIRTLIVIAERQGKPALQLQKRLAALTNMTELPTARVVSR